MWLAEGPAGVMAWKKKNSFQKKVEERELGGMKWSCEGVTEGEKGEKGGGEESDRSSSGSSVGPSSLSSWLQAHIGSKVSEWVREWVSERVIKWISEWVFCSYFSHQSFTAAGITNVWLWFDWFLMVRVKRLKDAAKANPLLLINQIVSDGQRVAALCMRGIFFSFFQLLCLFAYVSVGEILRQLGLRFFSFCGKPKFPSAGRAGVTFSPGLLLMLAVPRLDQSHSLSQPLQSRVWALSGWWLFLKGKRRRKK